MTLRRIVRPVALLVMLVLLAACSGNPKPKSSQLIDNPSGSKYQGVELTPPRPRPQFTLTDQNGDKFEFGKLTAGAPTFLFFGYTRCPDVCPTTMADIMQALKAVPVSVADRTRVVFVTTDVKHDTGAVLTAWLHAFDKNLPVKFVGLRGTQSEIDAAQAAAGIPLAEDEGQTHSALALLYGPDDYAHVSYAQNNNQESQMAHDLPIVASASRE